MKKRICVLLAIMITGLWLLAPPALAALDSGDGADGAITISASTNINTDPIASERTVADGEAFSVSSLSTDTITVTGTGSDGTAASSLSSSIAAGDEVILINLQGGTTAYTNVGNYEFCEVSSVASETITCNGNLTQTYGESSNADLTGQKVIIQRVPNYTTVTINSGGILTTNEWDGTYGGLLVFRASGALTVNTGGEIDLDYKGYRGGPGSTGNSNGYQGESFGGTGIQSTSANLGGGGGGVGYGGAGNAGDGGGGGSYALSGIIGQRNGSGTAGSPGAVYGDKSISKLFLGSGGGQSGHYSGNAATEGRGGNGGGIIYIHTASMTINGTVTANGEIGDAAYSSGQGGAGSGGTIFLETGSLTAAEDVITAAGDTNNASESGAGGDGRIRLEYTSLSEAHTSPPFYTATTTLAPLTVSSTYNVGLYKTSSVTSTSAGASSMTVVDTSLLGPGEEVVIMTVKGTNAGQYEFKTINSVSATSLTFSSALSNSYDGTTDKVIIQQVAKFSSVTVNNGGVITTEDWDGTTGGAIFLKATGDFTMQSGGSINVDALGFAGGSGASGNSDGYQGESYNGTPAQLSTANYGGGGGGQNYVGSGNGGDGGGGGAYGGAGGSGALWGSTISPGAGGGTYGANTLSQLFLGSGGGQGGHWSGDSSTESAGGDGGGIVYLDITGSAMLSGEITADGETGDGASSGGGPGGGGSGGSVYIQANSTSGTGTITATGGNGGASIGGGGGGGRIAFIVTTTDSYSGTKLASGGTSTSATTGTDGTIYGGVTSTIIGGLSSNNFKGFIDEMKVYNFEKSAAQMKQDYERTMATLEGTSGQLGGTNRQSLTSGLVGYWTMDETSTPSVDSSGNGLNLTWAGNTTGSTGQYAGTVNLDGSNDYLSVADSTALDLQSEVTLSAWVKLDTAGAVDRTIIEKGQASSTHRTAYALRTYNGNIRFLYWDGGEWHVFATSGGELTTGTWHHVTVTYKAQNASSAKVWLNGQPQSGSWTTGTGADPMVNSTGGLYLGGDAGSLGDLDGMLDDVRIYSRLFSNDDAQRLYSWEPGPIGHWNLDEGTGTTTKDFSANGNTGTLSGATWTPGKIGNALNFDGTDDSVSISDNDILDLGTGDFTLEAWVKGENLENGDVIFSKTNGGSAATDYGFHFSVYDSLYPTLHFATGTTAHTKIQGTTALSNNQWYHIAVVVDRDSTTNTKVYLNGQAITTTVSNLSTNTSSLSNSVALTFGSESDGGYYFDGLLDDVKIYNYARSQEAVAEDMRARGLNGSSHSPTGYWKFDDQQGQSPTNSGSLSTSVTSTLGTDTSVSTDDPTWKTAKDCKVNGCISVDGQSYVETSHELPTSGSISLWTYPTSTGTDWVSPAGWKYAPSSGGYVLIDVGSGTKRWRAVFDPDGSGTGTSEASVTGSTVSVNTWQHVTMTWQLSGSTYTVTLYVDGVKQGSTTYTGTPTANIGNFFIGTAGQSISNNFTGLIDEVKVYDTSLSQSEVQQEINSGFSVSVGVRGQEGAQLSDGAGSAPIAEWKMDENTGTSVADTSGNGYDGSASGGPTWIPGKYGSGISFDGTDDYLNMGDQAAYDGGGEFTWSFWINVYDLSAAASGQEKVLYKVGTSGNRSYQIAFNNTGAEPCSNFSGAACLGLDSFRNDGATRDNDVSIPISNMTNNRWHHVTFTYSVSSDSLKAYLDGSLIDSATVVDGVGYKNSTANLNIGGNTELNNLEAKLDNIKIYNYARTASQVAYDYNRGRPLAHWKFDECQGTTAYDATGNGFNGTIITGTTGGNTAVGECTSGSTSHMWYNGASGKLHSSLQFDGSNDYVDALGSVSDFSFVQNTGVFTLAAWVKIPNYTASTQEAIIANTSSTSERGFFFIYENNVGTRELRLDIVRASSGNHVIDARSADYSINDSNWHHVAAVGNGSTVTFYIDGKPSVASGTMGTFSTGNSSRALNIGRTPYSTPGAYMDGQIDDVRVYNYPLSEDQIQKVMNNDLSVMFSN